VKRAVIFVPGKWRDCWTRGSFSPHPGIVLFNARLWPEFQLADEALKGYDEVPYEDVSIMSPCFLTDLDHIGAATLDNILFGKTTWVSGHKNIQPTNIEISAFEVIDELIDYYLDTKKFPALEAVVFAGHSAGGQMTQRYAALKKDGKHEDRVHYWVRLVSYSTATVAHFAKYLKVANPGSLLWLTEDRPKPDEDCEDIDSYKYGLEDSIPAYALGDANDLGRKGLVDRFLERNVHYAFGLLDHGAGDTRCQAMTQGSTHLERGQNFMAMLDDMGGMPKNSTVDYIPGVTHDGNGMVNNDAGLEKVRHCKLLLSGLD